MSTTKYIFPSAKDVTAATTSDFEYFDLQKSIAIESNRDEGEELLLELDDDEVIELEFDDQTTWVGRAGDIPEMLQTENQRAGDRDGNEAFVFPSSLESFNEERGFGEAIGIKLIKFFTKKTTKSVTAEVVKKLAKKLDSKLQPKPGLYKVDAQFQLKKVTAALPKISKPYCLFLHGTASSFEGSFGKMTLEENDPLWKSIRKEYDGRILALEHFTFSKSPFENLIDLLELLPEEVDLHLISHSRGGLVGELLAHYHADNKVVGFKDEGRDLLEAMLPEALLEKLDELTFNRKINIGKFIRVACPAEGTTIISKRTDHFLNALFGALQIAVPQAAPVLSPLKELTAAVVAQKENPKALPGIEVMSPYSDFQRLINSPLDPISAPLTIVAGNSKMGFTPRGFLSVLTRLYFFGQNDWIVDTKYMLRGKARTTEPYYFIDSRVSVNHFSYFKNTLTQERMVAALVAPKGVLPEGFKTLYENELNAAERDLLVGKYNGVSLNDITADKPVMIIVPGILGSNLEVNGKEIYLHLARIAAGGMSKLTMDQENVVASSVIGFAYRKFGKRFDDQFQVMTFAFDWRKSVETEGQRLTVLVEALLQKVPKHPVVFAAHSMGGLVVRELMFNTPVWKQLQARKNFKCIFFGSPLGGSYLIPEVLVGEGKRIKQLARIDIPHVGETLLKVFSTYTGLLQLLPVQGQYDFAQDRVWSWMKEHWAKEWTSPSAHELNAFQTFRNKVLMAGETIYDSPDIIYVAGKDDSTLDGMFRAARRREGRQLEFTSTPRGDGSVTWDSGIPRVLIQRNQVYYVDVNHGALLSKKHLFDGVQELFRKGRTNHKHFSESEIRGKKKRFFGLFRDEQLLPANELNLSSVLMGGDFYDTGEPHADLTEIHVSISAGHLDFSQYPVMIGHLWNDGIVHAEAALNAKMNQGLQRSHRLKNYPELIGENQVFRKEGEIGAVIVGLGKPEELSAKQLEETLLRGMLNYLLEVKGEARSAEPVGYGLSVLFIGTGYIGMTLETSLKAILSAAHKANQTMAKEGITGAILNKIEFVELYDDKAKNARKIVNRLMRMPEFNFKVIHPEIRRQPGIVKRILEEQDSSWWKRLNIEEKEMCSADENDEINLEFTISSGKAHSEKHSLSLPKNNIEALIHRVSRGKQWDKVSAKVIFEFLIPAGLKEEIRLKQNMLILVDKNTAAYPWEMIQDELEDTQPLCTEVGMIRQLSTPSSHRVINHVAANRVLVIGDPVTEGMASPLPGAEAEAREVNALFEQQQYDTVPVIQEGHSRIMSALFAEKYKFVHLAGHGFYDPERPNASGMAIGNEVFLTPTMIRQLPFTPDFVFVNCCHLGFIKETDSRFQNYRSAFGANFGVELIESGVKALIVAGWAVNDGAAKLFAQTFYREMFEGKRFGEAVLAARNECYLRFGGSNTWGAYQCYGDYNYKFVEKKAGRNKAKSPHYDFEEEIIVELENELAKADTRNAADQQLQRLQGIEEGMEGYCASLASPLTSPKIYELLAQAYLEYRFDADAKRVFEHVFQFEESTYSIRSKELYEWVLKKQITARIVRATRGSLIDEADLVVLEKGVERLTEISHGRDEFERLNLIGGQHKIIAAAKDYIGKRGVNSALRTALSWYEKAYAAALDSSRGVIYPLVNCVSIEVILIERGAKPNVDHKAATLNRLQDALGNLQTNNEASSHSLDQWHRFFETNVNLCALLIRPSQKNYDVLLHSAKGAQKMGGSVKKWQSEKEHIGVVLRLLPSGGELKGFLRSYISWLEEQN